MEIESAVTENRWTNANKNSSSNSFSSETKGLTKKRTDKAQRSSLPSSSSVTDTEESEDVSSLTSEGSTENPSNSPEKADEHERQEKTRKRRSDDSSASSASSEATSMTSNNVCARHLECGEDAFLQATSCDMSRSMKEKFKEYAKKIVQQNICFPPSFMNCELSPKYSSGDSSRSLYLTDLIGSCYYEYQLQCRNGFNSRSQNFKSHIDANCFCKHNWSRNETISGSSSSAGLTDQCWADINCLCQLQVKPLEDTQTNEHIPFLSLLNKAIKRYDNTITQMSCKSSTLEDTKFSAYCNIDNTKDRTGDFVTLSDVKRLTKHFSDANTTSVFAAFSNTFCFALPREWYPTPPNDTANRSINHQRSARNLSEVLTSVFNSNALAIAGVASIATFSILFFGVIFLLIILMFYKDNVPRAYV